MNMKTFSLAVLAAAAFAVPALAHHSFSMFDAEKTVTLNGTWSNAVTSTISAVGATLSLGDQSSSSTNVWSNAGTITATAYVLPATKPRSPRAAAVPEGEKQGGAWRGRFWPLASRSKTGWASANNGLSFRYSWRACPGERSVRLTAQFDELNRCFPQ